jgi:hypothetical protein
MITVLPLKNACDIKVDKNIAEISLMPIQTVEYGAMSSWQMYEGVEPVDSND